MQQKLFNFFLPKATPKIKKNVCYIFTDNIGSVCSPVQVVIFSKDVSIL